MIKDNFSVLRIVWEFAPKVGGSISHILELSEQIDSELNKQIIIAPYIDGCEDFDRGFSIPIIRLKAPKISHIGIPIIANAFYSVFESNNIINIIKEHGINVIHFHSPIMAAYLIPFIRRYNSKIKIIVMCHGWPGRKSRQYGISYTFTKLLIPLFPPDKYLLLKDGSQINELQSILDKKSIPWDVVYHGIDSEFFKLKPELRTDGNFTILFPHRPVPIKNPDIAIAIFKRFLTKINDNKVSLLYLSANSSDELKMLAKKEGIENNVKFLNELSGNELLDCINSSSIVIGTSLNSNNGRAIQEAMACEKPVVVFDNEGNMSTLIKNMENGILVDHGNIDDFVDALILLYSNTNLRSKLGKNARKTIVEKRSWRVRIEKELSTYYSISQ